MSNNDLSYLLEVLHIGHDLTEDQYDEKLRSEARDLGLDVEEHKTHESKPFKSYVPEYHRRSESIDSRASQSTGLTSNYSDSSQAPYHGQRRCSRASVSFRDYDNFLARGVPNGGQSISFSPLTTPSNSVFSLPLSQPSTPDLSTKKHFRRIRGLSMLKLRTGSDSSLAEGCPHCPPDSFGQRRAVHKLPCGHRLCTQALRGTVKVATESRTGAVPSCCSRPIPGSLVEQVMTQEEQNALLEKLGQWDEAISLAPSINSSRRGSAPSIAHAPLGAASYQSRTLSEESRISLLLPKQRKDVERMMGREDYKLIRTGQSDQRDRFLRWAEKQRAELASRHQELRDTIKVQHEADVEDMTEHHASAMAEAEDKQVKAESDMRAIQQQEKRDNATALKHMEAYCAGTYNSGELHHRTVTDEDLTELEKTRRTRDQMDAKHESQINVLRGEQGRRIRLRTQRQDRELQDSKCQHRKEELELERMCNKESVHLDDSIASKQRKIRWRWELQMAIFTKKVETETGVHLESRLPVAEWSSKDTDPSQFATHSLSDCDRKAGISHAFAVCGVSR